MLEFQALRGAFLCHRPPRMIDTCAQNPCASLDFNCECFESGLSHLLRELWLQLFLFLPLQQV
jgi:hypothetical protein